MQTETVIAPKIPPLPVPRDPQTPVWRYLNFAKFMWLLEARALFFPYTEQFPDAMEGGRRRPEPEAVRNADQRAAVSSWHASDHESEAMWRLYSPMQEALALRSTYYRLRQALPDCVRIHLVQYGDAPLASGDDPLLPFFYKRKAYEHEKELRAIIDQRRASKDAIEEQTGWHLRVEVGELLESVYVSPFAQRWFYELVQGILRRYDLQIPVEHSELTGTVEH